MNTNQKYLSLAALTGLVVVALTIGGLSFAQSVTPVTCSPSTSTVSPNGEAVITASGGNGAYIWSGEDLAVTNSTGAQFAVSYPNPGSYGVTVTSDGETADCAVVVEATNATSTLACSPSVQTATVGVPVTLSASGGNGTYAWSSPDLDVTNSAGSGFTANYATTGLKTLTVTSDGMSTTCAVNVIAAASTGVPTTPGLPNTGGGYGQ